MDFLSNRNEIHIVICNKTLRLFFIWLCTGLGEKGVRLASMDSVCFEEVYRLASQQAVVGLLAAGLDYASDVKTPKEVTMKIMSTVLSLE